MIGYESVSYGIRVIKNRIVNLMMEVLFDNL